MRGTDRGQTSSAAEQALARLADAERRVRELEAELAQADRLASLGTTAAIIAHEFNNILTPVLSFAQLAQAARHDAALVSEALERTIHGVERATQIAESILGFARREGDAPRHANVGECVRSAISCLARAPEKDGVSIETSFAPGCDAAIRPVALQQVVLNLILNAMEAMRPGGGSLRFSAERFQDEGSTWNIRLVVEDTGRGVAEEMIDRIFEPFATTGGTGLGLVACRRLIEEVGGKIEVSSVPGAGARFTITLPAAEENADRRQGDRRKSA